MQPYITVDVLVECDVSVIKPETILIEVDPHHRLIDEAHCEWSAVARGSSGFPGWVAGRYFAGYLAVLIILCS